MLQEKERIALRFTDLRRLLELWVAWYSIGVDGWLATDESTHICSLDLVDGASHNGQRASAPPYPSDPKLDHLLLHALNQLGLQVSRRGTISLSHTTTGEEITRTGEPVVAMLEGELDFFAGKQLSLFSELRREYGDFGSHTMALQFTVEDRQVVLRHASFEMNNRRRGLKLDLWETISKALAAYEEIFEQGAALGHNLTGEEPEETPGDQEDQKERAEPEQGAVAGGQQDQRELGELGEPGELEPAEQGTEVRGFPFPCESQTEASHLARLSNQVAPARHAVAEGIILTSTHSLRELAALVTFARFCEPMGAMQRI